ncbi:MFS transporter [Deinococcus sp. A31D244]|uniref:MFS transporter n=1 Tax=Deinococcus sp. A31D244 TaxID=3397675 RepID=UPI0039E026C9
MNLPQARWATMAAFFINGGAMAVWAANIPSVREQLRLSETTLGFALLAIAVGSVGALSIAGRLIARYGSRPVIIATAIPTILLVPVLIAAPSLPVLVLTLLAFGFCLSLMDVAMNAHGVMVEGRLGRPIMSSLHALWSAGSLVGAGGVALLLRTGLTPLTYAALAAAVLAALALVALPRLLPSALDRGAVGDDRPTFVLPRGPLLGIAALALLAFVAEGAIADWSAVYIRDALNTDRGLAAGGFVAFNLAMFAARLLGDPLRARFSAVALLRGGGVLAALGMAVALLAQSPAVAFVGFALTGLGLSNVVPVLFSAAGALPGVSAATGVAAAASAGYAGFLIGPPVIGVLAGVITLKAALLLVVAFAALIAVAAGTVRHARSVGAAPASH